MINKLLYICIVIFSSTLLNASEYGLYFYSHPEIKEKRTSLHLTSDGLFKQNEYFAIEFDLKLYTDKQPFGNVIKIIQDNEKTVDLVLNNPPGSNPNFYLISGDEIYFSFPIDNTKPFTFFDWNHVKIEIISKENKIRFSLNNLSKDISFKLKPESKLDIYFGANNVANFSNSDIPPMIIKNILVWDKVDRKMLEWRMEKHCKTIVYDEINHQSAKVTNPKWIIDDRIMWKKVKTIVFDTKTYPVFDNKNRIFFISSNQLLTYSITNNTSLTKAFQSRIPTDSLTCQFIYNANENAINMFDFENKCLNRFDIISNKWDKRIITKKQPSFWHHNSFISPVDSSLVQIFGYGFHKYYSDAQVFKNGTTQTVTLKNILPRYLSATAITDSTLYVYGGIGNKTGKQEQGIYVMNDLYAVDLKTFKVKKLWEKPLSNSVEVAAHNLIINNEKQTFYALCYQPNKYNTQLLLNEYNFKNSKSKTFANPIPYLFQDTESFADMFFCEQTSQLIAVTLHKLANGKYEANLYSLSYTPLQISDASQPILISLIKYWWVALLLVLFIISLLVYKFYFRKQKTKSVVEIDSVPEPIFNDLFEVKVEKRKEGIYLLGGFQIINKDSVDITGEFTPVMKLLLISIILFTYKSGKGISNSKIGDLIWPEKSAESARNNRSVNISKIRLLLSTLTDIQITNENSYWKIELGENGFCDYIQSLTLLKSLQKKPEVTMDRIVYLLGVISSGELLPNIQTDWTDNFKSEYSNDVIDLLLELRNHESLVDSPRILIAIADTILVLDTLNEDALKFKCSSLIKLGRIKIAKQFFETFVKEYKNVMGEDFSESFDQFVKN